MAFPSLLLLRSVWGGRAGVLEDDVDAVWQCMTRLADYCGFLADPWHDIDHDKVLLECKPALAASMLRTLTSGDGSMYFFNQDTYKRSDPPKPYTSLDATVSYAGYDGYQIVNKVMIRFGTDTVSSLSELTVEMVGWLLGLSVSLVKDMVDVWRPDAVSLDSSELVQLGRQCGLGWAAPVLGYVSWLSPVVIDERDVPEAPIREKYKGGVIVGIDPGSPDPVSDATKLAVRLYRSMKVKEIPGIQDQTRWAGEPQ